MDHLCYTTEPPYIWSWRLAIDIYEESGSYIKGADDPIIIMSDPKAYPLLNPLNIYYGNISLSIETK